MSRWMLRFAITPLVVSGWLCAPPVSAGSYEDILKAVDIGDTATVTAILQRGMDINTVDSAGNSLLMLAVGNDNRPLVELLLAHRARVGVRNNVGDTALMSAALKGQLEIVRSLLGAGADIDQPGWTALHYATFGGQADIARLLLTRGASVDALAPNRMTALLLAARSGNTELVKLLLEAKADPRYSTEDGITALKLAETGGYKEIARLLRQAGALK